MTKLQDYPNIPASSLTGDDKILVVRKNDQGLVKLSSLPANIPDDLKTDMNNVLNKKFKTSTTYPPAIWDDKVNLMAVCPEETASGNVVTFVNGADDVPLKKCEASIEPIQDLHGYSKPWGPGCGKNLIPDTLSLLKARNTAGTWSNNVYTSNSGLVYTVNSNGTITVNGTTTSASYFTYVNSETAFSIDAGSYVLHGTGSEDINLTIAKNGSYWNVATTSDKVLTLSESATVFFYSYTASGKTLNNFILKPMFEKGSASSAWEPYSNVCPISGSTEVNVVHRGKNLWEFGDKTVDTVAYIMLYFSKPLPAGTYTVSCELVSTTTTCSFRFRKEDGSYLVQTSFNANAGRVSKTLTLPEPAYRVYLYSSTQGSGEVTTWKNVQIEASSSATDYESYSGTIYTVSLGRTVYKGTADFVPGQGASRFVKVDMGDLNWVYDSTYTRFYTTSLVSVIEKGSSGWKTELMSDIYNTTNGVNPQTPDQSISEYASTGYVYVKDLNYTDATAFKNHVTGHHIVYPMATPENFTFTPVPINSKLGFNTMWADTGDLEVIYRSQGTAIPVPVPIPTTLIEKTITQNGTYSAEDDNADGYSEVVVDVATQNPGRPVTLKAESSDASYTYTVPEDGRYLFVSESSGSDHIVSLPSGKSWILSSTNTNRGFFAGVADLLTGDQVAMNDNGGNYKCKWVYKVDPSISFESVDFEETLQNPGETRKFSRGMNYDVMSIICYGCTNINVYDYSYVDGNTCSVGYFNYGKIYIKVGKESTFARIYWNPLNSNAFYRRVDFKITINTSSYPIAEEASF